VRRGTARRASSASLSDPLLARSSTMPAPFLSYLRVYEPLRAFSGPQGAPVRAALERGPLDAAHAGRVERELCLRPQLGARLLPGDGAGPSQEVLVVDGADGPLVCPLDLRPRAAAAVLSFLEAEPPLLRTAALPVAESVARRRAKAAMVELGDAAAHVVSATWTVPLPWFALVDPQERQLTRDPRRVWWRVPMWRARGRAVWAERIVRDGLGDEGPAEVLAETARWLERFDRQSVVELDYGGIVELLDGDALLDDPSAEQVRVALAALRAGDREAAGEAYAVLRRFWAAAAGKQGAG
jgi:hypothetical protein